MDGIYKQLVPDFPECSNRCYRVPHLNVVSLKETQQSLKSLKKHMLNNACKQAPKETTKMSLRCKLHKKLQGSMIHLLLDFK